MVIHEVVQGSNGFCRCYRYHNVHDLWSWWEKRKGNLGLDERSYVRIGVSDWFSMPDMSICHETSGVMVIHDGGSMGLEEAYRKLTTFIFWRY